MIREARCTRCGESFNPADYGDLVHVERSDGEACGGQGVMVGAYAQNDGEALVVLRTVARAALESCAEAFGGLAFGGGGLTCEEADQLCALYVAVGLTSEAAMLADQHARSDEDDEDAHHDRYLVLEVADAAADEARRATNAQLAANACPTCGGNALCPAHLSSVDENGLCKVCGGTGQCPECFTD